MWIPGTDSASPDDWVVSAAGLPVAFAQVREDPWVDQQLIEEVRRPARVLMIASGGDTAAWLATLPVAHLDLVDLNPAQLHLTRFKLHCLMKEDARRRLALLGHTPMPASERSLAIERRLKHLGLPADALGPSEWVSRFGPDGCGRYEWLFARLRDLLSDHAEAIASLMQMVDPEIQSALTAADSELGKAIDAAWTETMDLARLVKIFGPDATANRRQSFAAHFIERTRDALTRFPAVENPFLQQIFLGRFLREPWPWLSADCPKELPAIEYHRGSMSDMLLTADVNAYDMIHLSNILDWVQPAEATRILQDACRCLSPGGRVIIRQLNSQLDIPSLNCGLDWLFDEANRLHAVDRSFFYRSLHIGTRF